MSVEKSPSKKKGNDQIETSGSGLVETADNESNTQVKNLLLAWLDYIMQKPENQKFIEDIHKASNK